MAVSKNSPRSPQAATPTRMESDSFGYDFRAMIRTRCDRHTMTTRLQSESDGKEGMKIAQRSHGRHDYALRFHQMYKLPSRSPC